MLPRREKPRTLIGLPIKRSGDQAIATYNFVKCRNHNVEIHPCAVCRRWFQEPADYPQVIADRNIIVRDKLSRAARHSSLRHRDTGVSLNASFGGVIYYKVTH